MHILQAMVLYPVHGGAKEVCRDCRLKSLEEEREQAKQKQQPQQQ